MDNGGLFVIIVSARMKLQLPVNSLDSLIILNMELYHLETGE